MRASVPHAMSDCRPPTERVVDAVAGGAVLQADIAIIGSGIGGATTAYALRDSGADVVVLERGDFLPRERDNWSPESVHRNGRYKNSDPWVDGTTGRSFVPGNYHYVGGSSKFYGATMPRFRVEDFGELRHPDGVSPAWPIGYQELEPFYTQAERIYWVHGGPGDPTEPPRSEAFPFPAVEHEPAIASLAQRLRTQGLRPFPLPQAIDWRPGGRCVRCGTCDSYPCMVYAKGEADVAAMRPALAAANVRLVTNANVVKIATRADGTEIAHLEVEGPHGRFTVVAKRYVLAGGAVNSAALLLRSRDASSPDGVANRSGHVGRNYMAHLSTFVVGARPARENRIVFQKTLGINDWYLPGPDNKFPLGNIQALGKLYGDTIKGARRWVPIDLLRWILRRSVDFFVETEDLPLPENRVEITADNQLRLTYRATNVSSHTELVRRAGNAVRRAGYPFIFSQGLGVEATSHQCGTIRMGHDPRDSPLNVECRAHDVDNLWVLDTSVFPSSAAVNPALTAAANALRVVATGALNR
jgi:choline dehydrogenase-like flavoprotein